MRRQREEEAVLSEKGMAELRVEVEKAVEKLSTSEEKRKTKGALELAEYCLGEIHEPCWGCCEDRCRGRCRGCCLGRIATALVQ